MMLQAGQIDNCCGVIEIGGFPDDNYRAESHTPAVVEKAIAEAERFDNLCAMYLITLNDEQHTRFGKAVRKAGYKCVARNLSKKTYNEIYMFVKKRIDKPKKSSKMRVFGQ